MVVISSNKLNRTHVSAELLWWQFCEVGSRRTPLTPHSENSPSESTNDAVTPPNGLAMVRQERAAVGIGTFVWYDLYSNEPKFETS